MRRIYLDHNASAPVDPRVHAVVSERLRTGVGNPSSIHGEGRAARRAVEDARDEVAALLGGEASEITFVSGATEANVTALLGQFASSGGPRRLLVSAIEHASVWEPLKRLGLPSEALVTLPVDSEGRLDPAAVAEALRLPADGLVIMGANNETGALQPLREIAALAGAKGVRVHVDAVQLPGKADAAVARIPGVTSAVVSGHKFGAPQGVGALWIRKGNRCRSLIAGGGQERDRRGGTENVASLIGFGLAARLAREELPGRRQALLAAEDALLARLQELGVSFFRNGPRDPSHRLPGTLNLGFPGRSGEALVLGLDLEGVAVGLGSACASGAAKPSHVLQAMGLKTEDLLSSLRISCGASTTPDEARAAAERLREVLRRVDAAPTSVKTI
jgi:cysteine desulfurase